MKKFFPVIIIFFVGWSCASQKKLSEINPGEVEAGENTTVKDSIEYGIETFDAQFEAWYKIHNSETNYHSLDYYEQWNKQYVAAWNENAKNPDKRKFFEPIVGYNPDTKYGLELNHKLFYYFQYVENVLKVKIMSYSPKSSPF